MHIGFLFHDQGTDLVFSVVHVTVPIDAAVLLGGLCWAGARIEIRVVSLHGHLASVLFIGTHLGILAKFAFSVVATSDRACIRASVRVIVLLS